MKRRPPLLLRLTEYAFRFKLTPVGRAAMLLVFFSAMGVVTVEIPIYQIFCAVLVLFGLADVLGLIFRPSLQISAHLPERVAVGDTLSGQVTVTNRGRLPALDLMCGLFGLPPGLRHVDARQALPVLARGESGVLTVTLQADRRGEFPLPPLHVHSTFPLNLMRFGGAQASVRKVTVIPQFARLDHVDIPIAQRYQSGDLLLETRSGDPPEYVGNRDYVPGEPVRRLDFRAWARVGKPVVREYQDEYCSRVALVLDTCVAEHRWWRRGVSQNFEAAVSLCAALADNFNETDTSIDLFAAGPDLFLFQAAAGATHFESVLEILAAVQSTRHDPFDKLSPVIAESLESISAVICLLLDWDPRREELTRRIVDSGCALRVILIRETPPTMPFPEDEMFSHWSAAEITSGAVSSV